ncbi:hypothetical protein [Nocardia sp. NPDC004711]
MMLAVATSSAVDSAAGRVENPIGEPRIPGQALAAVGFLGTLAGQLFVTTPAAILAAAQYFTTINQPIPSTK